MKTILFILLVSSLAFTQQISKNLVSINFGVLDYKESGTRTHFDASSGTYVTTDFNRNGQVGHAIFNYQRNVIENVYLGFSLGSNSYRGVSIGLGF
jgi:hypothetical protein